MTLVRLALIACLVACVKPSSTVAPASPRSNYDFYHLCDDANADGVCAPSAERGTLVDTNLTTTQRLLQG